MSFLMNPRQVGGVTNTLEAILRAEVRTNADAGRSAVTSFVGGSYIARRVISFNRIHLRVASRGGAPTLSFGIYQVPNGFPEGAAVLIASVAGFVVPAAPANFTITPSEGLVSVEAGHLFVLWGRSAAAGGNFTLRAYAVNSQDLQNINVPSGLHPTVYSTVLTVDGGIPASIDTRSGTGDLVPATANNPPDMRFEQV